MNAIRAAGKALGTHDLTGCVIYATGYPCPMCMSAIIWANIKEIHVSGLPEDADAIGFRDQFIYDYLDKKNEMDESEAPVRVKYEDRNIALELYRDYSDNNKEMY